MNQPLVSLETIEKLKSIHTRFQAFGRKTLEAALEGGEILARERIKFPERGPNAKGWGEFLKECGIDQKTAWKWIQLWKRRNEISGSEPEMSITEAYEHLGILWKDKKQLPESTPEEIIKESEIRVEKVLNSPTAKEARSKIREEVIITKEDSEKWTEAWKVQNKDPLPIFQRNIHLNGIKTHWEGIERIYTLRQQSEIAEIFVKFLIEKYPDLQQCFTFKIVGS